MCGCKLGSCDTSLGTVTGRCKQSNKPSECTKEDELRPSSPAISSVRIALFYAVSCYLSSSNVRKFPVLEVVK